MDKIRQNPTRRTNKEVSNVEGSLYAILFNAHEGGYSYDLRMVYHSLINANVPSKHITALEGNGTTKNELVKKSTTIKELDNALTDIRQKSTPNDRLFVYVTNHGGSQNNQSYFKTFTGDIWEKDFEHMTQDLPIHFGVFYFTQCNAGGFAERMGYGRNIGISSVNRKEYSTGSEDINIGTFFTHFLFPKIVRNLTIEEAFDEAVSRDTSLLRKISKYKQTACEYPNLKREDVATSQLRWQNADPSQLYLNPLYIPQRNDHSQ